MTPMADENDDDDGAIFKVDTVPPPAGDGDAYNAPTKVGPVSAEAWVELIKQADAEGKKSVEADKLLGDASPNSQRPKTTSTPAEAPPSSKKPAPAPPSDDEAVPKLFDEDVDESNAATLLHSHAKGLVDQSVRADASVFGKAPPATAAAAADAEEPVPKSILTPPRTGPSRSTLIIAACLGLFVFGVTLYLLSNP